jgi:hypothetical protein
MMAALLTLTALGFLARALHNHRVARAKLAAHRTRAAVSAYYAQGETR